MKPKAIFFDRDNTLIEDTGYVHKIEDLKMKKGILEELKSLPKGYKLFIITNQSGIGRGKYTEAQFHQFQAHLVKVLKESNIHIEKTYFCPHSPGDDCDCRKPSIKFIKEAEKIYNLDLKESYVVGDKDIDIEMGKKAGCKVIDAAKLGNKSISDLIKKGISLE